MRGAAEHCPDDLLARSRKGPLSPVERRALDAHLGVCGLCRAAAVLGALHDDLPELPSEDDAAVVARLAGRVVVCAGRGLGRARRVAIAAGVALMAMAGAAAAWKIARRTPAPPPPVVASSPPRSATDIPPRARPMPAPVVANARPIPGIHKRRGPMVDPVLVEAPQPEGPDKLFARANAARGVGDLRTAAASYALLERQYPESLEATVSLVSAGDLLARLGEPAAALDRFDRYLAESARGSLAPEALFGRARCLRALERPRDEAAAWRALLQSFPGSLYDRTARRRLVELGTDGPPP